MSGLVLTAVGIGTGVFFTYAARGSEDDYYALRFAMLQEAGGNPNFCASPSPERVSRCSELAELNDARQSERALSTVGFAVGGVAAVATASVWLLWPAERGGSVALVAAPIERGLVGSVTGAF